MKVRLIALVLVLLMLVALFVGGAQPQAAGLFPPPLDKLAHGVFFFILALLLGRFVSLPILAVVVLTALVGVADEWHQIYLPGRFAGVDDWLADLLGIGLAATLLLIQRCYIKKKQIALETLPPQQ